MKQITTLSFCLGLLLQAAGRPAQSRPLLPTSTASVTLPPPQTINHGGTIETKYDGFNYETIVTLKKMRITCGHALKGTCVSVEASLHSPGLQLDYVRYANLQLIFETEDWDKRHPLDQRDLTVVADGETIKLGTMHLVKQDIATERMLDNMKEVLEVSFPYQTFNKIVHAEVVEMKVGNSVFELRDKNIAALRDLNNRVKL